MWFKLIHAAFRLVAMLLPLLSGCHANHRQSMLHPASPASAEIAWLWWFLLAICSAVFFAVITLTAVAVGRRTSSPRPESPLGDRFIVVSGVVIPGIILLAILFASLRTQVALSIPETDLTIEVIGHQWWWEVRYPAEQIVTANEIYIPVGEPVRLELTSADVIHSLWIPNLQGKTDMIPGITNAMWIAADQEGIYRGQCAEYCGVQHALMALVVVALPREEFDAWVTGRQEATSEPATDLQLRGEQVFLEVSCNNCHVVADTPAVGERGPNLTHIGSRKTIAAGLLPNSRANLARWIKDPQSLKPGNLMPHTPMSADDLRALVEYLEGLK
jgi:cytochrome c oxidase subunit II